MRSLTELAKEIPGVQVMQDSGAPLTGITLDSRAVAPGMLFAALKGAKSDGNQFIATAVSQGAAAVLSEHPPTHPGIGWIQATNPRLAVAKLAAAYYAPQPKVIAAVTGTDGKTSVADFTRQLWQKMGEKAAAIGTLGVTGDVDSSRYPALNTTPDPVQLHRTLAQLAADGVEHVAMEASSHGLDQYRLDGVALKAAAFTNLTRDHLDYHPSIEAYFEAKSRLFSELLPERATAVLNADDPRFSELRALCHRRSQRVISVGRAGEALKIREIAPRADGQDAVVDVYGGKRTLSLGLIGEFQVMNVLMAVGLAVACGSPLDAVWRAASNLTGVPGRLELAARQANGAAIYVDYAHTPAALAKVLTTIRPHVSGKLSVVFGCGGDRDAGKRGPMGQAAVEFADRVYVTDDNPRSEDPAAIRKAVLQGAAGAREIGDRRAAIAAAASELEPGDALVIAGKGHEKTQTVGTQVLPFDDGAVAREIVKRSDGNAVAS